MSDSAGGTQSRNARDARPVIVRGRITKVNAEKFKDAPVSGIELGVEFDEVKANGPMLEIWFTYHAIYRDDVGRITMSGFLIFELDETTARRHADKFGKERNFEPSFAEAVVNSINYKCSTDAILPAKVVELTAPIVPPRIGLVGVARAQRQPRPEDGGAPPAATKASPAAPGLKPAGAPRNTDAIQQPSTPKKMYDGSPFKPQPPFPPQPPPPFKK